MNPLWQITNIGELVTADPAADSFGFSGDSVGLGLIRDAVVAGRGETILWAGPQTELPDEYRKPGAEMINARGRAVIPGLIDCHTHLIFAGDRAEEFEDRLRGATYAKLLARGGGILRTVLATREASPEELYLTGRARLQHMLRLGVTTVEAKSGYGLSTEAELKILRVLRRLNQEGPVEVAATFLGAHAVPLEYRERPADYVDLICDRMLPLVAEEKLAESVDAFCEAGAFSLAQTGKVFDAARGLGFKVRLHADQLTAGGGANLAAKYRALSADHLEHVSPDGIAALAGAGTVAVLLPGAALVLRSPAPPARQLIAAGVDVAVATDFNPGSSPIMHLPLCLSLACLLFGLSPHEALLGATRHAAKALNRAATHGCIARGYQADLVLLDTADWRNLIYWIPSDLTLQVFKAGREVYHRPA